MAKSQRIVSRDIPAYTTEPFQLVHTDTVGPVTPLAIGGFRFFLIMVDDFTRSRWIYLMHQNNEALSLLKGFWALVSTQSGRQIKDIRVDNGTEYGDIEGFSQEKGMKLEFSTPNTAHQNSVSERSNGLVCTKARAMLHAAGLPGRFWGKAVKTAVYLLNRTIQGNKTRTPYELLSVAWGGHPMVPDLSHLQVFGSSAFLHTPEEKRMASAKFEARTADGIVVGYEGDSIYRISTKKGLSLSSSVTFNETTYGFSAEGLPPPEEEIMIFPLSVLEATAPHDSLPSE
jgi:hypothetical protein